MNRRELLTALPISLATSQVMAAPLASPRALSARGEANIVALARLVAALRFFHPSDEAAEADWDALVVETIEAVEEAQTSKTLAEKLDAAFRGVAPTMELRTSAGGLVRLASPPPTDGRRVRWSHRGARLVSDVAPIFASVRMYAEEGASSLWSLDLGAGVFAAIPTAVVGTPGAKVTLDLTQARAVAKRHAPEDRRARLAAVVLLWGAMEHFFPYFDESGCDWSRELSKGLRAAAMDGDGQQFHRTLMRMVASLRDAHANVYYFSGPLLPIGWDVVEGRLAVTATPVGGASGLLVGDVITRMDGVDIRQRLAEMESLVSAPTPQWLRFKALQLLQERLDSSVAVLEGDGAKGTAFTARLAPIAPREAMAVTLRYAQPNLSEVRPGVVYVDLSRITANDFSANIDRLRAANGLVVDDRGYPTTGANAFLTHLITKPVNSHINEYLTVEAFDRPRKTSVTNPFTINPAPTPFPGRAVMLTGGGSMSWGETCALFFSAGAVGKIVGGPTAGTNGVINRFVLPGGYSVVYSGTRVLKADGSKNQGVGVQPDILVATTLSGLRARRDEVLERGGALAAREA